MRTSVLLRKARRHLWDGVSERFSGRHRKEIFICLAIEDVFNQDGNYVNIPVCVEISQRLGGCFGIEQWLYKNHNVEFSEKLRPLIQVYRKAWLNELIREYTAKGD